MPCTVSSIAPGIDGIAIFTAQSIMVDIAAMVASIPNIGKNSDAPAALTPNSVNEKDGIIEFVKNVSAMAKNIGSNLTSRENTKNINHSSVQNTK